MRFPWVSRARMESEVLRMEHLCVNATERADLWRDSHAVTVSQLAGLRAELDRSAAQYDALMEKYHELKLQGAAAREPAPTLERPVAPDPITAAITFKAGSNEKLRGQMMRAVLQSRAAGETDEKILAQIQSGISDDEGPLY